MSIANVTPGLRAIGAVAHPPVLQSGYDFNGGQPFEVQKLTVQMLTENPRGYVLNSMGTGKTKCALWAYDYLRRQQAVRKMIVAAPLSTLRFTWGREVMETVPHYKVGILHDRVAAKRLDILDDDSIDIFIINHDGVTLLESELISRKDIDVLVIDELAIYRNRSKRTAAMARLASYKSVVWGMTGSPTPNAPTDVFQQAKIVTPHTCPRSFTHFRDSVMNRAGNFKFVPKKNANHTAMKALQPNVRYTLDDIMELPPYISRRQQSQLGTKQAEVYKQIKDAAQAMVAEGQITAANAGVIVVKLLQISLGWVYTSQGTVATLDGEDRIKELIDVIDSGTRKTIVYVPYKHALDGLVAALTADGKTVAKVDGDTPTAKRDVIFNSFQKMPEPTVLAAHPQCVAHGITLTAADTTVWFGPITSSEIYEQANARIRRIGQTAKQLFLHLWATPMERRMYDLLEKKIVSQDDLLHLLEDRSS